MQCEIWGGLAERVLGALNPKLQMGIPRDVFYAHFEFSRPVLLSSLY